MLLSAIFGVIVNAAKSLTQRSCGNAFGLSDTQNVTTQLLTKYESLADELYSYGARQFVFLNVPPTSRSPLFLSDGPTVDQEQAAFVDNFNKGVQAMTVDFHRHHPDVSVSFTFSSAISFSGFSVLRRYYILFSFSFPFLYFGLFWFVLTWEGSFSVIILGIVFLRSSCSFCAGKQGWLQWIVNLAPLGAAEHPLFRCSFSDFALPRSCTHPCTNISPLDERGYFLCREISADEHL
jgi:hypothetical protein